MRREARTKATGYSNSRCYAKILSDCSAALSKEHYVSRSILDLLGDVHVISNASWLPPGTQSKPLRSKALGSRILCKRHNEMLSVLDAKAKDFLKQVIWAFSEGSIALPDRRVAVDGDALELWVLKACCGFFASGELLVQGRQTKYDLPVEWLRILFQDAPWTRNTGLCIRLVSAKPHLGFAITPAFANDGTTLAGGGIELYGIELFILMDPTRSKQLMEIGTGDLSSTAYRPSNIDIVTRTHKTTIELQWKTWQPTQSVKYHYE